MQGKTKSITHLEAVQKFTHLTTLRYAHGIHIYMVSKLRTIIKPPRSILIHFNILCCRPPAPLRYTLNLFLDERKQLSRRVVRVKSGADRNQCPPQGQWTAL